MKTTVTFEIEPEKLSGYTDEYLASLWYVAQANPEPIENKEAGELAEYIGREIIRRFLDNTPPPLWSHQGAHHARLLLTEYGKYNEGVWEPHHVL